MAITIQPIKDNRNGQTPDNGAQMVDKINSNFKNVSEGIGEVDGDAVHLGDQSSQVNYETPKTSADMAIQAVKDDKGNVIRDTYSTNMATGIDEFPEFSDKGVYNAGDIVRKDGRIYEFKQAHSSKPWIGTDARETSLREEVKEGMMRKFLADKSIIGMVNIDINHLYNIPKNDNGENGEYIFDPDQEYDSGWIVIPEYGGKMSISGATIHRVTFFNDVLPLGSNFISSVTSGFTDIRIPDYAKLALVTLLRSANPEGYKNLIVTQPGGAAMRMELEETRKQLKERLYKNRSFSGKVDIDNDMLVNIGSGGTVVYIPDAEFNTAFVDILDGSQYLEVTGANILRVAFFRDYEINTENYIGSKVDRIVIIPANAVMATITLRKADNPDGLNDLRVLQNGTAPSSLRLFQDTGELFTEKSLYFSRTGKPLTTAAYLTTTPYLPISGRDDIIVKGANNASVPVITFWDSHYNFIAPISQTDTVINRVYKVSAADIPAGSKYIRCTRNDANEEDTHDSYVVGLNIAALLTMHDRITPKYKEVITGKNLINPSNLLRGISYSASTGLISTPDGILSNKLRLSPGTYTIKGVVPYSAVPTVARILRFNDKNEMVYADKIELIDGVGQYTVTSKGSPNGGNLYIDHWRIVLQIDTLAIFDPNVAQFEKSDIATDFEPCQTKLVENPAYKLTPRMAFLTGASSSIPGAGYFETACEMLGFSHRNVAISGESVMQHATKAWRGLIYESDGRMTNNIDDSGEFVGLYTFEELENMDIFVTSHIHNYDVSFRGKEFERVETTFGYYTSSGVFTSSGSWALDKYNLSPNDLELIVNTITSGSTTPHALFFDRNNNFISGDIIFDPEPTTTTPVIDRKIDVPKNAAYVLIKRLYFPDSITTVRGVGYGILQKNVAEYEAKGYDANNNPLTVPMDKKNLTQRIVPYGGQGAAGAQRPDNLYDERYAAGYDYLLKKYALDCYNLRLNPESKYYGTKSGKPVIIVCTTQWNDAYVRFNEGIKKVAKRHGAIVADIANNVGFSYRQIDPENPDSIRWSSLHCNNAAYGGSGDTETVPIHGVMYTGMGWHPTEKWDEYIQLKRAQILADAMRFATYNNSDFGQII